MGCKRLTEGEYNKIKKVAKAHKVEWLSEKYGYGATVIRQIRRSKNWSDYKKQFIDNKRVERAAARDQANLRKYAEFLKEQNQAAKEEDDILVIYGVILLCAIVATIISFWMTGGF